MTAENRSASPTSGGSGPQWKAAILAALSMVLAALICRLLHLPPEVCDYLIT